MALHTCSSSLLPSLHRLSTQNIWDGLSLKTLSQWKDDKVYQEYKDISSGIRSTQLKKNPEWGTGIMDDVYMMDLSEVVFLKAASNKRSMLSKMLKTTALKNKVSTPALVI